MVMGDSCPPLPRNSTMAILKVDPPTSRDINVPVSCPVGRVLQKEGSMQASLSCNLALYCIRRADDMDSIRRIVQGCRNRRMISSLRESSEGGSAIVSMTVTWVLEDLGDTAMVLSVEGKMSIAARWRRMLRKKSRRVMADPEQRNEDW